MTEREAIDALADVSDALGGVPVECLTRNMTVRVEADGRVIVDKWKDEGDNHE